MPTENLGLPIITGNISANVPQVLNNLAEAVDDSVFDHIVNYAKHPGIATTTNSGNAYAVTLNPTPASYGNGLGVVITVNADSTGAATLNVNGLGAKPILKANGNPVTNLKANGVYTVRYNPAAGSGSGAFILQGEGGEYGNVTAADVLLGKIFGTENGLQTGTLIRGRQSASGTITTSNSTKVFTSYAGANTPSLPYVAFDMTILPFRPNLILFYLSAANALDITVWHDYNYYSANSSNYANVRVGSGYATRTPYNNGVVDIPVQSSITVPMRWVAYE